jgi:hypothetical protein
MSSSNSDCDSKKRKKSPSSSPTEKQHKVNYTKKRDLGTKMLTKEDLAELRRDIASDLDAKLTVKLEPVFRKVTELEAVNEQLFRMLKLNNIIIHGAQEPPAETLSTLVATLNSLWQTLGLKETAIWVNDCFRLGKRSPGFNRPILVKLVRHIDKRLILDAAFKAKTNARKLYFNHDLTPMQQQQQKMLRNKIQECQHQDPDVRGNIRGNTLVIMKHGTTVGRFEVTPELQIQQA